MARSQGAKGRLVCRQGSQDRSGTQRRSLRCKQAAKLLGKEQSAAWAVDTSGRTRSSGRSRLPSFSQLPHIFSRNVFPHFSTLSLLLLPKVEARRAAVEAVG